MTDKPQSSSLAPTDLGKRSRALLYADPPEAAKAVHKDYLYWTGKLTDSSFELSVLIIAANWAVFGSIERVLNNCWAKSSISLVMLGLGINLAGAWYMAELHRKAFDHAEASPKRWRQEFNTYSGSSNPWPFTKDIESLGRTLRKYKTLLPLGGGILFLVGLVLS